MQSNYQESAAAQLEPASVDDAERVGDLGVCAALFPDRKGLNGRKTLIRQLRILGLYIGLYVVCMCMLVLTTGGAARAFALGLIAPGAGFWAVIEHPRAIWISLGVLGVFSASLVVWFGTGNVVFPVFVWAVSLFAAPFWIVWAGIDAGPVVWSAPVMALVLAPPLGGVGIIAARGLLTRRGLRRRARLNAEVLSVSVAPKAERPSAELSEDDIERVRLLLDRALQPVEAFDGFEWIDQFQTSAVRYQLNFLSYALSIVQAEHMPAMKGYMHTAQDNLAAKQQDPRIWRYWKLENMWGNLRASGDPVARDNIMYSGFVAAQLAYRRNSVSYEYDGAGLGLDCVSAGGARYAYNLEEMIEVLRAQYEHASYGLLACEPNWIYPLCNAITASAIAGHDAATGRRDWDTISDGFRSALETEFITPGGRFVPFRSSYTGAAPPMVGGAVMQAFPCYFLNSVLPDIAQRQWACLLDDMRGKDWCRALWPIDVGNYGFSRASSYAATAVAAREMGDDETADHLLMQLHEDCPAISEGGIAYRPNASLWAHANEVMARCGRQGSLQRLTARAKTVPGSIYIEDASYPDVLVAKAVATEEGLEAVLYPGQRLGVKRITLGGLRAGETYRVNAEGEHDFQADARGKVDLNLPIFRRMDFRLMRAV